MTLSMRGPTPFLGTVMSVFMDMRTLVGKDFENGLANMNAALKGDAG